MREKPFLLILLCLLAGLVVPAAALGNIPPPGRVDPPPLLLDGAAASDLLNFDLRVYVAAKPIYCILVEKDRQRLRVLRHDGRLQVIGEYVAATGESSGRKEKEGDAKTPEGVYFITKIFQDRKVSVFGTRAFHLNYPNYFDVRDGRSGYGIFIHGTNKELRLNSSNGCVTLRNSDLDSVADFLTIGMPVFIVPGLGSLADGRGDYPDLAGNHFDGAKALLIPDAPEQAEFANLFLVRVNGQTVVVGEYWPDMASTTPQLAVAYLQGSAGNRWSVVDRGPAEIGSSAVKAVTIAGLPTETGWTLTAPPAESGFGGDDALFAATPLEERYLAWYYQPEQATAKPTQTLEVAGSPATWPARQVSGVGKGLVYGVFLATTAITLALAWLFARRQERGHGAGGPEEVGVLRDEVTQAVGTLQAVQKRIDEEAINVKSLEELQGRMADLERSFQEKQEMLERLSAEQEALRPAVDDLESKQSIGQLQDELAEIRQQLAATRQTMAEAADREAALQERLAGISMQPEPVAPYGEEIHEVLAVCTTLRGQVAAMAEAIQTAAMHPPPVVTVEPGAEGEMAVALQAYSAELQGVLAEVASIRGAVSSTGLETVLQELRGELQEEQRSKLELMSQLGRMGRLEEELAARSQENQALRRESEARQVESVAEKMALEATLSALRQELAEARDAQEGLRQGLDSAGRLEADLVSLKAEHETLQRQLETLTSNHAAEKEELATTLAARQLELQTAAEEKAGLVARLDHLAEVQEELAVRSQEVIAVRHEAEERLAQASNEKVELETSLEALRQELSEAERQRAQLTERLAQAGALQAELTNREQEIAALRQEAEAYQVQMVEEKGELEAMVEALRQELSTLVAERAAQDERLGRMAGLDEELACRAQEIVTLRQEGDDRQAQAEAEKVELETMAEALSQRLEAAETEKAALTERLSQMAGLEAELATQRQEMERVRQESEKRYSHVVAEKVALDWVLESLRHDLREAQNAKSDMAARLGRLETLEAELADRDRQIDALHAESLAEQAKATAGQSALELAIESLRQELRQAQAEKAELAVRLGRLDALEAELFRSDRELAALRQESEAQKALRVSEQQALEVSLAALRQELAAAQAGQDEQANGLVRLNELETALADRERELAGLQRTTLAEKAKSDEERQAQEAIVQSLRLELQEAQSDKAVLESRLSRISELEEDLARRDRELAALREGHEEGESEAMKRQLELESALATLRQELRDERAVKLDLASRLGRLQAVADESAQRGQEVERLRQESAEFARQAAALKSQLDVERISLQNELRHEQEAKAELLGRLGRMSTVEEELAAKSSELTTLRQEQDAARQAVLAQETDLRSTLESIRQELAEAQAQNEALSRAVDELQQSGGAEAEAENDKMKVESDIAEVVLARQIEVASLTSALQEAKERFNSEHELVLTLRAEIDALQELVRQDGQSAAPESKGESELLQEVIALRARVAELERKVPAPKGVPIAKVAEALPSDVLLKWMGTR